MVDSQLNADAPRESRRPALAVVHGDLAAGGGAELYARRIVDACGANGFDVRVVDIDTVVDSWASSARARRMLRRMLAPVRRLEVLTYALVLRHVRRHGVPGEVAVFSYGECGEVPVAHIRVMHAPAMFDTSAAALSFLGVDVAHSGRLAVRRAYVRLASWLAGGEPSRVGARCVLTVVNSAWTAAELAQLTAGGTSDAPVVVVHPPVEPITPVTTVDECPRDPRLVVAIGRLVPNKRFAEAIDVVQRVRADGHDLRLVVAGRGGTRHTRELLRLASRTDGVEVRPDLDAAELAALVSRASIGLHMYRMEHFGIAVAEMILAGVVPLVYDGGGVRELVTAPDCRFVDRDDAVRRLGALVEMSPEERSMLVRQLQVGPALQAALHFDAEFAAALAHLPR